MTTEKPKPKPELDAPLYDLRPARRRSFYAFSRSPRVYLDAEEMFWSGLNFMIWSGVVALSMVWVIFLLSLLSRAWGGLL